MPEKEILNLIAGIIQTQNRKNELADLLSKMPPFEGHAEVAEFSALLEQEQILIRKLGAAKKKGKS